MGFTAEGVAEPYRLYTGSWRTPTTVKYFGLSEDTLHSDSGFVLVKLQKPRLTVRTEGEPRLMPEAAREFSKIKIGDEESVKSFTEDFGSHYIKSLTVGDAVYQILALDRNKYQRARQEVLVEKRVTDFNQIYEQFLAPWMVKESGAVQAASGDPRVKALLDNRAITQTQFSRERERTYGEEPRRRNPGVQREALCARLLREELILTRKLRNSKGTL